MPEAVSIGRFVVPLVPVGTLTALMLGMFSAAHFARRRQLDSRRVGGIAERAAYAFILGARLGFVVLNWSDFKEVPLSALYLWQPGYLPFAGVLAAAVTVWLHVRPKPSEWRRAALVSLGLGGAIATAVFVGVLGLTQLEWSWNSDLVRPGDPLPEFTLRDLQGREVGTADLLGQPAILNFWATWCPPCRREMPALDSTYQAYREQGLMVVGIDVGENPGTVRSFLSGTPVSYPIWLDSPTGSGGTQQLFRSFGGVGLPTTVFVDANGIVRRIRVGELNQATFSNEAEALLP